MMDWRQTHRECAFINKSIIIYSYLLSFHSVTLYTWTLPNGESRTAPKVHVSANMLQVRGSDKKIEFTIYELIRTRHSLPKLVDNNGPQRYKFQLFHLPICHLPIDNWLSIDQHI